MRCRPTPLVMVAFAIALAGPVGAVEPAKIRGADASFLFQVEAAGGVFREGTTPTDAMAIFRSRGINTVRVRLWVNPPAGQSDLASVLATARRARAAGLSILLDLHYSDTWADPGAQAKPAAWASLSGSALQSRVREYTRFVVAALAAQGTPPAIVQIGNEITNGLLWPDGQLYGPGTGGWPGLAALLQAGIAGVRDAIPADPLGQSPQIMIHIDRGGDNAGARWFFDQLALQGVAFELIGLSYYPWWHGSLAALQANLTDLAARYNKPVCVVETAYPWTLGWNDNTNNTIGLSSQLQPGYPATTAGQKSFLAAITAAVDGLGTRAGGVVVWAPDWIAAPNLGSTWENLALFDFSGAAVLGWEALVRTGATDVDGDGKISLEDLYAWHAAPTDLNADRRTTAVDARLIELSLRSSEAASMASGRR